MTKTQETAYFKEAASWSDLILGSYSIGEVLEAVNNEEWQLLRVSMKSTSLKSRYIALKKYLEDNKYSLPAKIRVTNYVYALKRGGMIK